ncbi:gamma-aminobutyric acid receptor subunit alpha-2-like [Tachysurus ichikawai]
MHNVTGHVLRSPAQAIFFTFAAALIEKDPAVKNTVERWQVLFTQSQILAEFSHISGKLNFFKNWTDSLNVSSISLGLKDCDGNEDMPNIVIAILTVIPEDSVTVPFSLHLDATTTAIILEGTVLLEDLENLPEAMCLLFGIIYALNLQYPLGLRPVTIGGSSRIQHISFWKVVIVTVESCDQCFREDCSVSQLQTVASSIDDGYETYSVADLSEPELYDLIVDYIRSEKLKAAEDEGLTQLLLLFNVLNDVLSASDTQATESDTVAPDLAVDSPTHHRRHTPTNDDGEDRLPPSSMDRVTRTPTLHIDRDTCTQPLHMDKDTRLHSSFQGGDSYVLTREVTSSVPGGSPTNRLFCGGLTTHPGETSFVTKPIRERNWTAQHGNGPQPAPDQRVCINLCHKTRVATWNVQTLLRPGAATLLSRELCRYNISLAGLCEVRWHGNSEITTGDHYYFWSGPKRQTGLYGVALAISKDLRKSLISWTPRSDRLLSARFFHQHGKMTVIAAYAPTDVPDEDAKDAFFDQLHQAVGLASPHDIIIILTDTNATLSISDRSTGLPVGTTFADRSTNDNEELPFSPSKLFTSILLTRALPAIRSSRRPQQASFMPNRSTIDQISVVRLLIEKTYEFRKDRHLYIGFIDLKAAFDTICHTSLWSILHALGVPPKIVALFKLLYSNAQSCVCINGRDSDWFPISSGVRQGCVAAPDLFNCIIDHLMSRVWERVPGVSFGSYHLTDLEYADDTILLSTSYSQLRDALAIYSEEAEKLGLQAGHRAIGCLQRSKDVGKWEEVAGEGQPVILSSAEPQEKVITPKRSQSNSQCQSDPKISVAQLIGKRCLVSCSINGAPLQMLLDSGAQVTM